MTRRQCSILLHESGSLLTVAIHDDNQPALIFTGSTNTSLESVTRVLEATVGKLCEDDEEAFFKLFVPPGPLGAAARPTLRALVSAFEEEVYVTVREGHWLSQAREKAIGFKISDVQVEAVASLCFAIDLATLDQVCQMGLQWLMSVTPQTLTLLEILPQEEERRSLFGLVRPLLLSKLGKRRLENDLKHPWTNESKINKRRSIVEEILGANDKQCVARLRSQWSKAESLTMGAVRRLVDGQLIELGAWGRLKSILDGMIELSSLAIEMCGIGGVKTSSLSELARALPHLVCLTEEIGRLQREEEKSPDDFVTNELRGELEKYAESEANDLDRCGLSFSLQLLSHPSLGCFLGIPDAQLVDAELIPSEWDAHIHDEEKKVMWFKTPEIVSHFDPLVQRTTETIHCKSIKEFQEVYNHLLGVIDLIFTTQNILIEIDICQAFARLCSENRWAFLDITNDCDKFRLRRFFNPLIKVNAVPNDLELEGAGKNKMLLLGDNGAGKSSLLQAIGMTVLLTQVGSPVPASGGSMALFDHLHYSIASDSRSVTSLLRSQCRTLLLLDEFCSSLEPASAVKEIARSLAPDVHAHVVVSTHLVDGVVLPVGISEAVIDPATHKLHQGEARSTKKPSAGVQVAASMGFPKHVIERAKEILATLEQGGIPTVKTN